MSAEGTCAGARAGAGVRRLADGRIEVVRAAYTLTVAADGRNAALAGPQRGAHPVVLELAGALDRTDVRDETLALEIAEPEWAGEDPVVVVRRRSTAWRRATTRIVCAPEGPELTWEVEGEGRLDEVALAATRAALGGRVGGLLPSGHAWGTLFTPNPGAPARLLRAPGESAVLGVTGGSGAGRGHWFFTPSPLCLAFTEDRLPDDAAPETPVERAWWGIGLGAPVRELTFPQLRYVPADGGWHLVLAYEGHTEVAGVFRTPTLQLSPGHPDPYAALAAHRAWLAARGFAPARTPERERERGAPAWWFEPMFCGWGAQGHRANETGRPAPELSSRAEYDRHLAALAEQGLDPGTVVIDDKWQRQYARWEPDEERWPDLRGWIAERHAAGQRVLLWWRAWANEGAPDAFCVRTPDGRPVVLDPSHPGAAALLRENIHRMLSPDGLDADGLKIDFTADTPTGHGLTAHGPGWGIALLYDQLALIHGAAKEARKDALVVTHTPHPAFAEVTDMIRLNDMLRLDDPEPEARIVPQMRYRAAVVRAACPDTPVDTDDWCAPDLAQWREYTAIKDELGVPALYLSTHVDRTGEPLTDADYAALRAQWARWRARTRRAERARQPAQGAARSGEGARP
ncbi:hypothetical protein FH609_023380 [Streptomyces sp. 3MP-14]|uniref:Alpha-galactosidase n=1 Tax=Streptomyces mimosae TaxID=2586635 RepID=A0A5N6AFH4_9ACTN|nr:MULTISPECIES: hypothetical protein [Streptomyces]KAB8166308.1 hypothetical protein FH607_010740 [Streptomyces mimosae]KAB8174101.1 hypothetical protein FH609_023380 [Streptomyces sp. 3MP-14]